MIGKCHKCGVVAEKAKGYKALCVPCAKAYMKAYNNGPNRERLLALKRADCARRREDPAFVMSERKRGQKYWHDLRHEAIMAYGGYRCACCYETESLFLTLDHIFNDGAAHRREIAGISKGNAGGKTWKWLRDHNYPAGFQVLCMNCNFGKFRNGGICPHKGSSHSKNHVNSVKAQTG